MEVNRVIIVGNELSGLGGMETVILRFITLLRASEPTINISLVFFRAAKTNRKVRREVNDDWLAGQAYCKITPPVRHRKLGRLFLANSLRKIFRHEKPDLILSLDPILCFISVMAREFSFHKTVVLSWVHFSVTSMSRARYLCRADGHLSISDGITNQLIEMGVDGKTIFTIYNPVPRHEVIIPRPEKTKQFIYVGRVIADGQKNMRELFEALVFVKGDWMLNIVGSGEDEFELKALANKLNITGQIRWHGWQNDPWHYITESLREVTSLILTSKYEGLVMALLEANSYGIYAISSDCETGPLEIIAESVNGSLYASGHKEKLAELLQQIVDGKTLPEGKAVQQAIEKFYVDNYLQRVTQAFNAIERRK